MSSYVLSNKKCIRFYDENPQVDFQAVNLFIVEFMERILNDASKEVEHNIQTKMLETLHQLCSNVQNLHQNVHDSQSSLTHSIQESLQSVNTSQSSLKNSILQSLDAINDSLPQTVANRMNEIRTEFLRDSERIINLSLSNNKDQVHAMIGQKIDHALDKMQLLVDGHIKNLPDASDNIKTLRDELKQHISHMIDSSQQPANNLAEWLAATETKLNKSFMALSDSTEKRLTTKMDTGFYRTDTFQSEVKAFLHDVTSSLESIHGHIDKTKNSSLKGSLSESNIAVILRELYPSSDIKNCSKITASGDFMLIREGCERILIENKSYSNNVPSDEVNKFLRDIQSQKCHGLFLSQNSGIVGKNNFAINIIDNQYVVVYIHNACYDKHLIRAAVDIVEHFATYMKKMLEANTHEVNQVSIDADHFLLVGEEYTNLLQAKENFRNQLKEQIKTLHNIIDNAWENLQLPALALCLAKTNNTFATTVNEFRCDVCDNFVGKNLKALAAHKRRCTGKNKTAFPAG